MESEDNYDGCSVNVDQILPGLYLGSMAAAYNLDLLQILDVKAIVTVAKGIEPQFPLEYLVIPVEDHSREVLSDHFEKASGFITKHLKTGSVLVHCANGISRSPSMVMAHLMLTQRLTYDQAFEMVSSLRPCTNPNEGFRSQLRALSDSL